MNTFTYITDDRADGNFGDEMLEAPHIATRVTIHLSLAQITTIKKFLNDPTDSIIDAIILSDVEATVDADWLFEVTHGDRLRHANLEVSRTYGVRLNLVLKQDTTTVEINLPGFEQQLTLCLAADAVGAVVAVETRSLSTCPRFSYTTKAGDRAEHDDMYLNSDVRIENLVTLTLSAREVKYAYYTLKLLGSERDIFSSITMRIDDITVDYDAFAELVNKEDELFFTHLRFDSAHSAHILMYCELATHPVEIYSETMAAELIKYYETYVAPKQ